MLSKWLAIVWVRPNCNPWFLARAIKTTHDVCVCVCTIENAGKLKIWGKLRPDMGMVSSVIVLVQMEMLKYWLGNGSGLSESGLRLHGTAGSRLYISSIWTIGVAEIAYRALWMRDPFKPFPGEFHHSHMGQRRKGCTRRLGRNREKNKEVRWGAEQSQESNLRK